MTGIAIDTSPRDAKDLVNEAWDYYRALGNDWIAQASTAIADLSAINVEPLSFSVVYNPDTFLPAFTRPTKPEAPTFGTISPRAVPSPSLDDVTIRALGDAPADPNLEGYLNYAPPAPPSAPMPTAPSDIQPTLEQIEIAARPDTPLPSLPTLLELQEVTVEDITFAEFEGVRPTFDLQAPPDGQLEWQEVEYSSELKDELTAKIRDMLQGGLGLPLVIEQAIFDRGRAREDRLSRKQIQEVDEDMAVRNLTEPNGIHAKGLRQVRADNREKVSNLNRDVTIRTAELAVENVKFAVGQGMALEQVLIQQNLAINDRALRAALETRNYMIARLNALISYATLQQTAYATDAQVFRDRIAGDLARLEKTKLEIEAQKLRGEVNRDLVAGFLAELEQIKTLAALYNSDIEAAKTRGEINVQRISAAKLLVDKFSAEVEAWGKAQDGYKSQVEAALGTTKFAEALASIFNTRMNGYKTKGDAYFQEGRFQIERNNQTLDLFRANLASADQDLRGQLAALDGQLRSFASEVALYEAEAGVAAAESSALDRTTSLKIENEKNRTSVLLESARIGIEQALKVGEIMVEQIKAKAAALSQLAAASQSGVNFGASLSGSLSTSYGFSRSQSWSGETPDHDASGSGMF